MIHKKILGLIFILFFSSYGNAECIAADLVLSNGTVYTGDIKQPLAKTIAIKNEFIVYVGSDELPDKSFCGNPRILDLSGQYIFPGFVGSKVVRNKLLCRGWDRPRQAQCQNSAQNPVPDVPDGAMATHLVATKI